MSTCDLPGCIHPELSTSTVEECRYQARREADYVRETNGPDVHTYVAAQYEAERAWHQMAATCLADHAKAGVGHPGCLLCPIVHGVAREYIG